MHTFTPKKISIDPYLYYNKCRDCGSTSLSSFGKVGFCEECGWRFYVHTVEEVQDSHPFPDEGKLRELGLC